MPMVTQSKVRREASRTASSSDGLPNSEIVYRQLKDQIISGDLGPGSRLIELTIAADFGVSRTPVREALKRLAAENLVLADPARGIVVHAPDASEIEDVFVVREALDGLASRLAAHRITPSELARLQLIVDSMRQAVASGRREQVIIANQRFHDVIYTAAGNAMLARVAGDLRDFVRRFTTLPFASPDRVEHVLSEHEAILEALQAHDPAAAEAASNRHLAAAREYLVRLDLEEFAAKSLG
jgi:DNA-binding GntR family transcriptional regulator